LQAQAGGRLVHILEDDALLSEHLEDFAAKAVVSGLFDNVDIIFTETYVHANPFTLRFLKEGIDAAFTGEGELRANFGVRLFGLAMMELTCTSSYFVAPNSIHRVLAVLKTELDAGPRMPLDLCLRAAADNGALKMACTIPFLTSVRLESIIGSTIASPQERAAGFDLALQSLLRYSFFVKRDLQGYAVPHLRQMVDPEPARDAHHQFMASILSSILAGANR
jgi:GR25 family glycosyltransferase involved in LPS biosynthesis